MFLHLYKSLLNAQCTREEMGGKRNNLPIKFLSGFPIHARLVDISNSLQLNSYPNVCSSFQRNIRILIPYPSPLVSNKTRERRQGTQLELIAVFRGHFLSKSVSK
jgi:hypothetical protein